jgi:hypothetical protein
MGHWGKAGQPFSGFYDTQTDRSHTHTHANKQTHRHTGASLVRGQVRKRRRRRLALRPVRPPWARGGWQRYAWCGYGPGPHRRPEVSVVCAAFALGNANSNECQCPPRRPRYDRLDSEAACKSAAASGGMAYGGTVNTNLLPKGCYRVTFGSAAIRVFNLQSAWSVFYPFFSAVNPLSSSSFGLFGPDCRPGSSPGARQQDTTCGPSSWLSSTRSGYDSGTVHSSGCQAP